MKRWSINNLSAQMLALNGAIFVSMLGFGIITPILPIYASDLGASSLALGLLFGAFSFSRALVVPWIGMLSDRYGRKPFLLTGLMGISVFSLLMITADSPLDLGLNRLGQGVFSAMLMPIATAMVADIAPPGFEGRAFSGFNTSFLLGLGLGPFLGGFIYDILGITANFLFMSGVSLLSFTVVLLKVGSPAPITQVKKRGRLLQDMGLLKDRGMQGLFINRIATNLGTGFFITFLPVLGISRGLSTLQIGMLFGINTLIMTLIQKPAGWLADSRYRLQAGVWGAVLGGMCKTTLAWANDFYLFLLIVIIEGIAAGIIMPAINALGITSGHRLQAGMGAVMGFFTMALSIGYLAGPIGGGWVADLTGLDTGFCIAGGIVVLGSLAPLILRSPQDPGLSEKTAPPPKNL
ncbi:MAG: MFS transporter [Desulfarculales bacterium]|nr:MFS transporter [Desulfarculales bacterium]